MHECVRFEFSGDVSRLYHVGRGIRSRTYEWGCPCCATSARKLRDLRHEWDCPVRPQAEFAVDWNPRGRRSTTKPARIPPKTIPAR